MEKTKRQREKIVISTHDENGNTQAHIACRWIQCTRHKHPCIWLLNGAGEQLKANQRERCHSKVQIGSGREVSISKIYYLVTMAVSNLNWIMASWAVLYFLISNLDESPLIYNIELAERLSMTTTKDLYSIASQYPTLSNFFDGTEN